jgi:outer membrane protein TolC
MKKYRVILDSQSGNRLVLGQDPVRKLLFLTGCLALWMAPAWAQNIDAYLAEAGRNNAEVMSRYSAYEASLTRSDQAGTLPDPELRLNVFLMPMERYMGQQLGEASVMQMFPWVGSLRAGREEADYMARMEFEKAREAKLRVYYEVRMQYYALYMAHQQLRLVEEEIAWMRTLEELALTKYSTGTSGAASGAGAAPQGAAPAGGASGGMDAMGGMGGATPSPSGATPRASGMTSMQGGSGSMVDVLLIQLQIKELENRRLLLRKSLRPQEASFNYLLGRSPGEAVVMPDTLISPAVPATLGVLQDSVLRNHPMIRMAEWDEKTRETQARMARLMGRPMVGLGLSYMVFRPREVGETEMGPMENGRNMLMPMATITLPIYRKKYRAMEREANSFRQAATWDKEASRQQLFTGLEQLMYDYEAGREELALLEEQIEVTQQALRLLTIAYSVGSIGMEEIIRQYQNLLRYKEQQVQAVVDQHRTVAGIIQLTGLD